MFEIGKRVVCIREVWTPRVFYPVAYPVKGEMYLVEGIVEVPIYGVCLALKELRATETVFQAKNFRPVDYSFGEEMTRIFEEIFKKITA